MAEITDSTGETREDWGGAALEEGGVVILSSSGLCSGIFQGPPVDSTRRAYDSWRRYSEHTWRLCYTYSIGPWLVHTPTSH